MAHRGDGVFTVAVGDWLSESDIAMLPDGTVVAGNRRLYSRRVRCGRSGSSRTQTVAFFRLGDDCRRFGRRRVDCEIRDEDSCIGVASVTLGRTGIVLRRHYRCGRPRFRREPRFLAVGRGEGVQRLSRLDHGYWEKSE
jgi:hypothetical protein